MDTEYCAIPKNGEFLEKLAIAGIMGGAQGAWGAVPGVAKDGLDAISKSRYLKYLKPLIIAGGISTTASLGKLLLDGIRVREHPIRQARAARRQQRELGAQTKLLQNIAEQLNRADSTVSGSLAAAPKRIERLQPQYRKIQHPII